MKINFDLKFPKDFYVKKNDLKEKEKFLFLIAIDLLFNLKESFNESSGYVEFKSKETFGKLV